MSVGISLYGNRLSVGIFMSVGISYTDATYNDKNLVLAYIYTNWRSVGTTDFTNWRLVDVLGLWYSVRMCTIDQFHVILRLLLR